MAVVLGTNAGFCTSSPDGDPSGSTTTADYYGSAQKDTSSSTAETVTEIGWYCDNATEEANFEVAIYTDEDGRDRPENIVGTKDATNAKGTDAGWKKVTGLNISISSSTVYWIAVQLDNTATTTNHNYKADGSFRYSIDTNATTLPDPWEAFATGDGRLYTIYAIWEGGAPPAATTSINIGDSWKSIAGMQINIADSWKAVAAAKVNIGDSWKAVDIT